MMLVAQSLARHAGQLGELELVSMNRSRSTPRGSSGTSSGSGSGSSDSYDEAVGSAPHCMNRRDVQSFCSVPDVPELEVAGSVLWMAMMRS